MMDSEALKSQLIQYETFCTSCMYFRTMMVLVPLCAGPSCKVDTRYVVRVRVPVQASSLYKKPQAPHPP